MDDSEQFLDHAMTMLKSVDPIPKLLPQVRLSRMPKDSPALIAIIDSWLDVYAQVLKAGQGVLDAVGVLRLDPNPRIAVLVEAGVLAEDHPPAQAVREAWAAALLAERQKETSATP
jgi:hypothetical protein